MTKDRKIELQAKIIHKLQEDNASLTARIKELEEIVNNNQKIIDAAAVYRDEHEKCIASLNEARSEYMQAAQEMTEQKKKYKNDMEALLKTIKKNI
jgi:hypothetical protein